MTTGGSSGGAVASAVLGMGALQLGTDGGGSIRIPPRFTGCFGHQADAGARAGSIPRRRSGTTGAPRPTRRARLPTRRIVMSVISAPDARDRLRLDFARRT